MRLVCISDTHGMHRRIEVPDGDVLLHTGDLCGRGSIAEVEDFDRWLATLPHRHKVVIAGNHDWCFQITPEPARNALQHAHYLQDAGVTLDGVRFWGSPWQPEFLNWAFQLPRGAPLAEKWAAIPVGTDVVLTHGPPFGFGDCCYDGRRVGCEDLLPALLRVGAKLHVSGHIHEDAGLRRHGQLLLANASVCDLRYRPVHPVIVIDMAKAGSYAPG